MSTKAIEIQQQDRKRKQIIVLAVGGVLLLLVMALQLPRLRGGESEPAATESTTATADGAAATTTSPASAGDAGTATATTTPPIATTVVPAGKPLGTAYYAGVVVPGGFAVQPSEGNLVSFSLLRVKDPFVQQVDDTPAEVVTDGGTSDAVAATPVPTPAQPEPTPATAPEAPAVATPVEPADTAPPTATTGQPSGTVEVTPKPPVPTFATVNVNGKPAATTVKQPFPAPQNLFVVTKLTDTTAQLGVAGAGSFSGGRKTITLTMGKPVTLVDQATGVRYQLELVYTGTSAEQIEGFTAQTSATEGAPAGEAAAADK
jgi:hypothetical protein